MISDPPRPEAAAVIKQLKELGVKRMVMLTGDSAEAASAAALALGIDEFKAQVLPEDKAGLIERYKQKGQKVIMAGDGINDSPALAAADVSVNYGFILLFKSGLLGAGLFGILPPAVTALLHNLSTIGICAASMRPCLPEYRESE